MITNSPMELFEEMTAPTLDELTGLLLAWGEINNKMREVAATYHSREKYSKCFDQLSEIINKILNVVLSEEKDHNTPEHWLELLQPSLRHYGKIINKILRQIENDVYEVPKDGNCFYSSVAHQLKIQKKAICNSSTERDHSYLRKLTVEYIRNNKDAFYQFMVDNEDFDEYLNVAAKNGTWADHLEIEALSRALKICIVIFDPLKNNTLEFGRANNTTIHLLYHSTPPEHYDSITNYPSLKNKYSNASGPVTNAFSPAWEASTQSKKKTDQKCGKVTFTL